MFIINTSPTRRPLLLFCIGVCLPWQTTLAEDGIDPPGVNWQQWRGPEANGVGRAAKPPLEWSEEKNVRWKVAIDGKGNASPIVWRDKLFLLTAINTDRVDPSLPKPEDQPDRVFGIKYPNTFYKFEVLCLDRNTGKELWRRTASEHVPHEGTHHDADFASASPTTDGERLYCWFGSAACTATTSREQSCGNVTLARPMLEPVWARDVLPWSIEASS